MMPWTLLIFAALLCCTAVAAALPPDKAPPVLSPIADARWRFGGELGGRIHRNAEQWLLRAPGANPGILDMFRRRDRHQPFAEHTPWAGEFAGKYLISAAQACRMSGDQRLKDHVKSFVRGLIATQASDGYLGPWPEKRRLMGDCDLWGHYHCMLGLLMWHDDTGDEKAYKAVVRAADRICRLYVSGGRRPIEAGNPCFNMSVLHIMAELYRRTGSRDYLAMCRRIEEDLPKDGDWLNKGVEGVPYWRLPSSGPRWEALHLLQGFLTLHRATGDERYRRAALNHWRSIGDLDRHPSGAFSTNEQASGTVYAAGSIETCCSVAWMALTIDVLRATGDPTVADEIELTLWNQALAAQHPSGSWCTYDTPLNGVRAPSYQQIAFQYRPGSPELNCCSVNSPRTLGMLSDWAVMTRGDEVIVNFYGPCDLTLPVSGKRKLRVVQKTAYPVDGRVLISLDSDGKDVPVSFRIPAWSTTTRVQLNGKVHPGAVKPGSYLTLRRKWSKGDSVELAFDMRARCTLGEGPDRGGRVAIHRGPLLLAFDAGRNTIEMAALRPIDVRDARPVAVAVTQKFDGVFYPPMGLWRVPTDGGPEVVLCDFASAGANGTDYAAWLPASHASPPAVSLALPEQGTVGKPGAILFKWSSAGGPEDTYDLVVARDAEFRNVVVEQKGLSVTNATVERGLQAAGVYHWKVVARNRYGATENRQGPWSFRVNPAAKERFLVVRADGCMAASGLDGSGDAACGVRTLERGIEPAPDRAGSPAGAVAFSGKGSGIRYRVPYFPETDYSFTAWVWLAAGQPGLRQVFSAWCRGMDDPLRVTVEGDEVSARIEAGGAFRTPGVTVRPGEWFHVAAVKQGPALRLYIGGRKSGEATVPQRVRSQSLEIGIGFNPLFGGGENVAGRIDDFAFYARALSDAEIAAAAEANADGK